MGDVWFCVKPNVMQINNLTVKIIITLVLFSMVHLNLSFFKPFSGCCISLRFRDCVFQFLCISLVSSLTVLQLCTFC